MTPSVLLRTERLTRSLGRLLAVNAVDFEVQAGELRSVIAPNGASKSTFFKLIAGELPPTSGRVRFDGDHEEHGAVREGGHAGAARRVSVKRSVSSP